jgi:hypothetical protein
MKVLNIYGTSRCPGITSKFSAGIPKEKKIVWGLY